VRRVNENQFELIDGERRLRLAKELGYETVSCEVIEVDDETADRMVWKVNTLRKDYKPKEKAYHWKFHYYDEEKTIDWISVEHVERKHTVIACLNIFALPEKYQKRVWCGTYKITHIDLAAPGTLLKKRTIKNNQVTYVTNGKIKQVLAELDQIFEQDLTTKEYAEFKEDQGRLDQKERVKIAKEKLIDTTPQVEIETPEDYEKAAKALKKEAKKRREAEITPEQKLEIEAKKQREEEEKKRKQELKKEQEKIRIRKEAEEIAKKELMTDKEFRKEVKGDLSESDIKGIEELEKDPILSSQDKRVIRTLIENGEIRGKKQISETIELYRLQRSRASKVSVGVEKKQKEIEKHLKQIAETASRLANLITALSGQFINYPETIQFLPPKEGQTAKLAMENLLLIIAEFKKVSDEARSKIKQLEVMNE
jgi:hypothetical protein